MNTMPRDYVDVVRSFPVVIRRRSVELSTPATPFSRSCGAARGLLLPAAMPFTVLLCCLALSGIAGGEEPGRYAHRFDPVAVEDEAARAQAMEAAGYAMMALGTAGLLAAISLGVTSPPYLDKNEQRSPVAATASIGLGVAGNLLLLVGIPLLVKGVRGKGEARRIRADAKGLGLTF
jgi:hypothetical protein